MLSGREHASQRRSERLTFLSNHIRSQLRDSDLNQVGRRLDSANLNWIRSRLDSSNLNPVPEARAPGAEIKTQEGHMKPGFVRANAALIKF